MTFISAFISSFVSTFNSFFSFNIFITRGGFWLINIGFFLGLAALFRNLNLLLWGSLGIASFVAMDFFLRSSRVKKFRFRLDCPILWEAGNPFPLRLDWLTSEIRSRWYSGIVQGHFQEGLFPFFRVSGNHLVQSLFRGDLVFRERGVFNLKELEFIDLFPFGIFKTTYREKLVRTIYIHPTKVPLKKFQKKMEQCLREGVQFQMGNEHSFLPKNFRDFEPQRDPLKKVNWRIFSRTGKLTVVEEELAKKKKLRIHLYSSYFNRKEPYEYALRLLTSLLFFSTKNFLDLTLFLEEKIFEVGGSQKGRVEKVLKSIAEVPFNPKKGRPQQKFGPRDFLILPENLNKIFSHLEEPYEGVIIWVGETDYFYENFYLKGRAMFKGGDPWKLD